jgi:hypothetical protein
MTKARLKGNPAAPTPAPWHVDAAPRGEAYVVRSVDGKPVAEIWFNGDDAAANARIVAASREMLAMLESFADEFAQREQFIEAQDRGHTPEQIAILKRLSGFRALLHKAKGG